MLKIAALSLVLIGGFTLSATALENRGSATDQQACEPDVHRLCDQYVPDENQIVACLQQEKKHLSPACAKVMSRR